MCWVCGGGISPDEERERTVMIQRKRLGAMRMRNTGTGSATGTAGTNVEVSSQRQGQRKAEGGEEGAQVNGANGVERDAEAGKARWARCGCWANAVVRPVICRG